MALYTLALSTGLRVSEIRSPATSSFDFDGPTSTVTIEAAYSKHRRRDVLPPRPDVAAQLRKHLALRLPAAGAFPGLTERTAEMLRDDLNAARQVWLAETKTPQERQRRKQTDFLAYEDSAGCVVDFHALRHTYITQLAVAGVNPSDSPSPRETRKC